MEIGQEIIMTVERDYDSSRREKSYFQNNKQIFVDHIARLERWLNEDDLPNADRIWAQDMLPKLKALNVPTFGPPGGTASRTF